jgi:hypothetical protein
VTDPDAPPPSVSAPAPAPAGGGRGGCMTTMIGFFAVLVALIALFS